jgi:hypothetical protein
MALQHCHGWAKVAVEASQRNSNSCAGHKAHCSVQPTQTPNVHIKSPLSSLMAAPVLFSEECWASSTPTLVGLRSLLDKLLPAGDGVPGVV